MDGRLDLARLRVDSRHRSVEGVRHPYRPGEHGDAPGETPDRHRLPQLVRREVDSLNLVVERVRAFDADLLGTQEGLDSMETYLRQQLGDYTFRGVGRDDGKQRGEMCGVFFKTARFELLDDGYFWLSETPEKPGSRGWAEVGTAYGSMIPAREGITTGRTESAMFLNAPAPAPPRAIRCTTTTSGRARRSSSSISRRCASITTSRPTTG